MKCRQLQPRQQPQIYNVNHNHRHNHDHDHDHDDDMALTMPAPPPDAVAGDDEEVELGRIDNYGVLIFG